MKTATFLDPMSTLLTYITDQTCAADYSVLTTDLQLPREYLNPQHHSNECTSYSWFNTPLDPSPNKMSFPVTGGPAPLVPPHTSSSELQEVNGTRFVTFNRQVRNSSFSIEAILCPNEPLLSVINGASELCSVCESDVKSKELTTAPVNSENQKRKRNRTIFTENQLRRLETEFSHQQYIVGSYRTYLAMILDLSESQVKVWFQNRRIKDRKLNLN